mgnify:CR=1 FL=1
MAIINHRFLKQIGWDKSAQQIPNGGAAYNGFDAMGMDGGMGVNGGYMQQQQMQMQMQQQQQLLANSSGTDGAKARLQSLLGDRNVKLILQVPLIFVNIVFIFFELLLG